MGKVSLIKDKGGKWEKKQDQNKERKTVAIFFQHNESRKVYISE